MIQVIITAPVYSLLVTLKCKWECRHFVLTPEPDTGLFGTIHAGERKHQDEIQTL